MHCYKNNRKPIFLFELEKLRRTPDEENFNEGAKAVLKLLSITQVPTNVKEILKSPKIMNLSPTTNIFWFLARGMKLRIYI